MSALTDRIHAVAAEHPDWSHSKIGSVVGCTRTAVWKALNPERAQELRRADNARRREAKLAWEKTAKGRELRKRIDARHRATCIDCGIERRPGSKWDGADRCAECARHLAKQRHAELLDRIEVMWNEQGMTAPQIARALGRTHIASADGDIQELRRAGRLVPRVKKKVAA